ncbi:uncharacterized protein LOC113562180 isoform X2 [Ooceraea biroi]|uniref:uncharacterized protein LOC113562180 isoform X2 n=1 Tax=Ooceraea biroi TaxID=2015173 RepID=UPI000F090D5B|nr:uncharacterized protein LOC113562180 isoform X2 [Ooceraea biroi]
MRLILFCSHICSERCTGMICLEAPYFNLNRILLQSTALWPFQQSKLVQLQFILISTVLMTAIICQITTFLTSNVTPKFAVKVLSSVLFLISLMILYSSYRFNIKILKDLMGQLHCACTKLRDENEIAIIQKYGRTAKYYTAAVLVIFFIAKSAFWTIQIVIPYLDDVTPINGCRPHRLYIVAEYFIDQQKYYYVILLHMNAALFIGILTVITTGTLMIAYLQHTCGMFRIACYRIEHAMEINVLKDISKCKNLNSEFSISKKIVDAVNIHREAIKLSENLITRFDTMYFCLTLLAVITMSLNLFQVSQTITFEDNIMEATVPSLNLLVLILYVFLANLFGQNVIDHNNEVYTAAYRLISNILLLLFHLSNYRITTCRYSIRWYMCPLHVQKLILLLLQRKAKEFHLTCGGLFIASFECLATLTKATMSYFTLMHSTRR